MILTQLHHDILHTLNLPSTTDIKGGNAYLLPSVLARCSPTTPGITGIQADQHSGQAGLPKHAPDFFRDVFLSSNSSREGDQVIVQPLLYKGFCSALRKVGGRRGWAGHLIHQRLQQQSTLASAQALPHPFVLHPGEHHQAQELPATGTVCSDEQRQTCLFSRLAFSRDRAVLSEKHGYNFPQALADPNFSLLKVIPKHSC